MVVNRYDESHYPPRKPRVAVRSRQRRTFTKVEADDIPVWGRCYGAVVGLHLELIRLSGLRWVQRHDGWVSLPRESILNLRLWHRSVRRDVVRRAVQLGWLETRQTCLGGKLEYRLRAVWDKRDAKVTDLKPLKTAGAPS